MHGRNQRTLRGAVLTVFALTQCASIAAYGQVALNGGGVMTLKSTREQLASLDDDDVLIMIDPGDIGTASFDRTDETIPLGEAAAREQYDKLAAVAVSLREAPEPLVAEVCQDW